MSSHYGRGGSAAAGKKEDFDLEAHKLFKKLNIDISNARGSGYDNLNAIYVNPQTGHKVYCGNINAAQTLSILQEHGITHVVNCQEAGSKNFHENNRAANITYFRFPIATWSNSRLCRERKFFEFFKPFFHFVDKATESGSVLIHCLAGAPRAGTSSCSYILYKTKSNVASAVRTAKTLRPIIDPIYSLKDLLQYLANDMEKLF